MKLEDAFERIVVINLPFKEGRRSRLEQHLAEVQIANPKLIRWERAICGDWAPPPAWWGAGNGAWGCLMSHLRIAQDAIHDGIASYCVLEDDAVFHPRAPEMFAQFVSELPSDWGQVYLGGQFLHREPERLSNWVVRPYNVNRTHAFALSKEVFSSYLQHIMNAPDYFRIRTDEQGAESLEFNRFHIDHQLGRAHERGLWKTYAPTWWIAGQQDGSSNISGRTNPQLWWHWRERGQMLPFFFISHAPGKRQREIAQRYLHAGYNTKGKSLSDIGLLRDMNDTELSTWLRMIAGEAVERWKLPGFEVPKKYPELPERVKTLWAPGVLRAEEPFMQAVADYPFNGFCGAVTGGFF